MCPSQYSMLFKKWTSRQQIFSSVVFGYRRLIDFLFTILIRIISSLRNGCDRVLVFLRLKKPDYFLLKEYAVAGNLFGLKSVPEFHRSWRHGINCFLLPPRFNAADEPTWIDLSRFSSFWFDLDDLHKERRFLLTYFNYIRYLNEKNYTGSLKKHRRGLNSIKNLQNEFVSEIFLEFRRLFIVEQYQGGPKRFEKKIRPFIKWLFSAKEYEGKCLQIFHSIVQKTYDRSVDERDELPMEHHVEILNVLNTIAINGVFRLLKGFVDAHWGCEKTSDRVWFMKKLRAAEVHWRNEDRAILARIAFGTETVKKTYAWELLTKVGLDRFKVIAFGKKKFCDACGRSSYTGDGRLWSCQRCVDEKIRPKARYCNIACQKADWRHHKMDVHSGPAISQKQVE